MTVFRQRQGLYPRVVIVHPKRWRLHGARTECRAGDRQRPGLGLQLRGL